MPTQKEHDDHKAAMTELVAAANSAGFTDFGKAASAHLKATDAAGNALNSGTELDQIVATDAMFGTIRGMLQSAKLSHPLPPYVNQLARHALKTFGLALSKSV